MRNLDRLVSSVIALGLLCGCRGKIEGITSTPPERTATPTNCIEGDGVFCLGINEKVVCPAPDGTPVEVTNLGKFGTANWLSLSTVFQGKEYLTMPPIKDGEILSLITIKGQEVTLKAALDEDELRMFGGTRGCEKR